METTKEQKEAIEMLDKFITEHKLYNIKQSDNLEDNIEIVLNLITKLQKENEELKEKESRIYNEVQESLSFEKFLIAKDIGPDLFNLGRFYISQIIYDILNNAENPEGIHKENKYIKYIDYIPVQKIKDKIEELNKAYEDSKDENGESEYYYPDYTIRVLEELLESE